MGDDLSKKGPSDSNKININEDWERRYWAKLFGVTEAELTEAVEAVGSQAQTVKKYLWS